MNERKNLAALLKPKAGEGVDAVYESTKGTPSAESESNENIKQIKKDIKTLSVDTKALLKEARSSSKSLRSIEKALVQPKAPEKVPMGGEGVATATPTVSITEKAAKKEETGNANIGADVALGALGGGVAAAGAVGLSKVGETLSNVGSRVSTFFSNMVSGNAKPGLAQVLDEEDRKRKEAIEAGPPRALFEQDVQRRQAEANQGADYAAATQTLANAGISPVSPEGPIKPGGKTMQPAEYEQAAQAQAAREAVMRGMRQRTRGGGVSEPKITPAEQPVQQPEAQVSAPESVQISFSEAKFAEADPENYKRFEDFRKQRYNEIKEEEKKKGFSDSIAKDIAEPKARKEAIEKFRKEIEAAGAGAVKTSQQGQAGVQPAAAQPTAVTPPAPQPTTAADTQPGRALRVEGSATSPEAQAANQRAMRRDIERARGKPVSAAPTTAEPVQATRAEETTSFDAAKLAEKDPETHAKFVQRQQQIIRERRSELEGLDPRERARKEERIKAEAFQTAASEYAPQASQVGAASLTRSENIGSLSAENKDLGRESSQPSTQPVVIQSNNNMSTQTYTPVPAQPRVDSSFTRHQQRNTAF